MEYFLARFLDPENDLSLLNKREVTVRIVLVSDEVLATWGMVKHVIPRSMPFSKIIEIAKKKLTREGCKNIKIEIYRYHHWPNFIGFLVNGNYLFTAMSY